MIPSTRSLRLWPQFGSILPFDLNPRLSAVKPPIRELFIRGSLESGLDRARIAIIGSRSACSLASAWAEGTAARLATAGWVVVSGGARGIDAAAHRGALKAAGPTWWVSGTAVDKVYPAEHRELLQRILAADGALISEVQPGGNSGRHVFRLRNRIIAGLVDALIVVAADERSGSLSTASYAFEQGTPVFVPTIGSVPETAGIHRLRSRPEITSLSLENLFTELSKSRGNCIGRPGLRGKCSSGMSANQHIGVCREHEESTCCRDGNHR